MSKIKNIMKEITPPFIAKAYRSHRTKQHFSGDYTSWDSAVAESTGYDDEKILLKVRDALLQVKAGEAAFERDSVPFYEMQYPFPLLAGLLGAAAAHKNKLDVLDYGGSLGSTYFQCKDFLTDLHELRWNIVEQKRFVDCGKQFFEDENLKFYYTLEEYLETTFSNVFLCSGTLQYMENPYDLLQNIINNGFDFIILDRTPTIQKPDDILTVQKVPADIYDACYPVWLLSEKKLMSLILGSYFLLADFDALDGTWFKNNEPVRFKGYIFRRKPANRS